MTIHQLPEPCWELRPPTDEERHPHYDTRADALRALKNDRENDGEPYPDTKPVQLGDRCWVIQSDGECEQVLDEEDEGWVVHHDSAKAARATAAAWGWTYSADGRFIYCPCSPPGDAEPAPPSPAEIEAAGQMKLPGVA